MKFRLFIFSFFIFVFIFLFSFFSLASAKLEIGIAKNQSTSLDSNYGVKIGGVTTSTSFSNITYYLNGTIFNETYNLWAYNQTTPFTDWLNTFLYNYNQTDGAITYGNVTWVPYIGATTNVDLGINNLTTRGVVTIGQDYEAQIVPVDLLVNGTSFFNKNVFSTDYVEIIPELLSLGVGTYFKTLGIQQSVNPISFFYGNYFDTSTLEDGGNLGGMWLYSIKSTSTINANSEVNKLFGVGSDLQIYGNASDSASSFYAGREITGIVNNLYGIYLEDFSKDVLELDGATINNSYAIYSMGGDIYFNNTDLTVVGNVNITENATYNGIYGGMWYSNYTATQLNFAVDGTFYEIFFTNATHLNGFGTEGLSHLSSSSNLTAQVSGIYQANYMTTGDGQNNHVYHTSIFINGVNQLNCDTQHKMSAGSDILTQTGTCLIRLNSGDKIGLRTADIGNTGVGNYYGANLDLVRIGN